MEEDIAKTLASTRERRSRKRNTGREAALEKVRRLKQGDRFEYEVGEVDNIYEEVSEKEYSRRVQDRQDSNFVEDDIGGDYIDDGREVFDEDYDVDIDAVPVKKSKSKKKKSSGLEKMQSIQSMFQTSMKRKKECEINLAEDDLLGEILDEMKGSNASEGDQPSKKVKVTSAADRLMRPKAVVMNQPKLPTNETEKPLVESQNEIPEEMHLDFEDDFEPDVTPEFKKNDNVDENIKKTEFASIENINFRLGSANIPFCKTEDGKQCVNFYWLDAHEDINHPDRIFLFGKIYSPETKSYFSCCLTIDNFERCIFVLPRRFVQDSETEVSLKDVYSELDTLFTSMNIMNFKSRVVTKSMLFELLNIPEESQYLEVRFPHKNAQKINSDLQGQTFSKIFGANASPLERFLLEKNIKGPCWLKITDFSSCPPISFCKFDISISNIDSISVMTDEADAPPLHVISLSAEFFADDKIRGEHCVAITVLGNTKFSLQKPPTGKRIDYNLIGITKPDGTIFPPRLDSALNASNMKGVHLHSNERALLNWFLCKMHVLDPDVIIGHDVNDRILERLIRRITLNKVGLWARLGRLKLKHPPKYGIHKSLCCGRYLCDIMISAKELIRCRSYDFPELISTVLKSQYKCIDPEEIIGCFSDTKSVIQFVKYLYQNAKYIMDIACELQVLPLAYQITQIAGNVMSRTLLGGRSERNEYLLLHAFSEKNYIVPDKVIFKKSTQNLVEHNIDNETNEAVFDDKKRKNAYVGGLVLEPKKGLYDRFVLLLDFNSLYPSIIQEYNLCYTTVARHHCYQSEEDIIPDTPNNSTLGILPTEIRKLVDRRKQVKTLLKSSDVSDEQRIQLDIRQKALKLTANSMYGCLGFSKSRFYAKPIAALITAKGREILMRTKELVESIGLEVIYGDTDSIMINTNCSDIDAVFKMGNKVKNEINKCYKLLQIDIDGVYRPMLLLKKKKYAALAVTRDSNGSLTYSREIKGLDIVRRDWCDLAHIVGKYVVDQLLSNEDRDLIVSNIHERMRNVGIAVRNGEVPIEEFEIRRTLVRAPEDYSDKKSQPHVIVATRMNSSAHGMRFKAGDVVPYIICEDGSNNASAMQRAYHKEELSRNKSLKPDIKYYLSSQVHPVVSRICTPIPDADAAILADCLGLDSSTYNHIKKVDHSSNVDATSNEDRYANCEELVATCSCGHIVAIKPGTPFDCKECGSVLAFNLVKNVLFQQMKSHLERFYAGWTCCEDAACSFRTQEVFITQSIACPMCRLSHLVAEYPESAFLNQLNYYRHIFHTSSELVHTDIKSDAKPPYLNVKNLRELTQFIDNHISLSAYSEIDFDILFRPLNYNSKISCL